VRAGEKPGFPRFRGCARYRCLEFPHGNRALTWNRSQTKVRVPGIGSVRLRKGRTLGPFGRAMLVRTARGWYALFECRREAGILTSTGRRIGLDRGIAVFAATSDGELHPNPKLARHYESRIGRLSRIVARRHRGGASRRKAVNALARAHERLRWARRDWLHKLSRNLINSCDLIAVEALRVRSMLRSAKGTKEQPGRNVRAKARLNFSISDAGWALFASMLHAKGEETGRRIIEVDAQYTSQTCSQCAQVDAQSRRSQAAFDCTSCGLQLNADVNAAKVILKKAELAACGEGRSDTGPYRSTKRTSAGANPVRAA
jgi:putative transposase